MHINTNIPNINKNNLLDDILKKLKLQFGTIEVGFFKNTYTYPNKKDLTEIARQNNEGINVPARPFFLPATDKSSNKAINIAINSIASGIAEQQALQRAGHFFTGAIKKEITSLKDPANSPITIKLKGSSNPLIDSGMMRKHVTYKLKSPK